MATFKVQSAMEYLMTYGWAILIIAVVLGALFGLGFFNSANLAPKVGPGACQVYRPNGPGTTSFINLEGTCNNELPQYAAQFSPTLSSNVISTSTTSIATTAGQINTVTFWMDARSVGTPGGAPFAMGPGTSNAIAFGATYFGLVDGACGVTATASSFQNQWVFVAAVIDNGQAATGNDLLYINGVSQTKSGTCTGASSASPTIFIGNAGNGGGAGSTFNGMIANVQLYNYSLPANDVVALYDTGIGGVPLAINNIAGWWQLNGNANDYSGNLNNGVPTSVVYTSSWTAGYTAP